MMHHKRFANLALVGAIVLPLTLGAHPVLAADCRIAVGGDDLTLTVALRGAPGHALDVDWGDGQTSTLQRRVTGTRARAFVRHRYSTEGRYPLRVRATGASEGDCELAISVRIPYPDPDDDDTRAILPPRNASQSSDMLGDAQLADAGQLGATDVIVSRGPTQEPTNEMASEPTPEPPRRTERVAEAPVSRPPNTVEVVIGRVLSFIFGGR